MPVSRSIRISRSEPKAKAPSGNADFVGLKFDATALAINQLAARGNLVTLKGKALPHARRVKPMGKPVLADAVARRDVAKPMRLVFRPIQRQTRHTPVQP